MDRRYKDFYARLYYEMTSDRLALDLIDIFDDIDHRSLSQYERRLRVAIAKHTNLREDAKAFLFVNLLQLVIVPILKAGNKDAMKVLRHELANDVDTLITEARERSQDASLISGHAIIDACSASWNKLATMQLRVWGASNDQKEYENG